MSPGSEERRARLLDLLADGALDGRSAQEEAELRLLQQEFPELEPEDFDRAAALTQVALLDRTDELPSDVRARIEHSAATFFAGVSTPGTGEKARSGRGRAPAPRRRGLAWLPWMVAAASVALALYALVPSPPSPERQRAALMAGAGDLVQVGWTGTEDPAVAAPVAGEVIWSGGAQEGYMRIAGLAANDPAQSQYQLWIFDRNQDERHPIDGGVFDVPGGAGEIVIPIDAKLSVQEPYLFAVTVEKPGGVVVSSRERIVLLAQVEG